MEDLKQKLQRLLQSSDWSAEDRNWLLEYLEKNDTAALQQIMQQLFTANVNEAGEIREDRAKELLEHIHHKLRPVAKPAKIIRFAIWKQVAAAVIIMLAGTGAYFLFSNKGKPEEIVKTENNNSTNNDIGPGGNKAILQLADGSTIILDSAQNGTLSRQGNAKVLKLDNGQLAYNTSGVAKEVLYNTITTPRGGQYQLTLADGSKVWLNATSSIRFPASFTGNERKVELSGEAYFEVAKNPAMPFTVAVNGMNVEVLGTHFNINSYTDEDIAKTTLLEGAVKVTKGNVMALLSPGQQAQLTANGQIGVNKNIDVEETVAWKNGFFNFNSVDIENIMRQISRWYDVDVFYQGSVSKETFSGVGVSRNSKLSQVIKVMEQAGIKFKIQGRKIIVTQ